METISRLDVPENWDLDIRPIVANEGTGSAPYAKWKTYQTPPNSIMKKYWQRDIKTGEIGCFVSHLSTLQASKDKYLLILEDDADMSSDFFIPRGTSVSKNWQIIHGTALTLVGNRWRIKKPLSLKV